MAAVAAYPRMSAVFRVIKLLGGAVTVPSILPNAQLQRLVA